MLRDKLSASPVRDPQAAAPARSAQSHRRNGLSLFGAPAGLNPLNLPNGIFVRGIVVSNRAKLIKRKDGSGTTVVVEHEIALQPGVVLWVRYFDPATDASVKVEAGVVTEFPKLKELAPVTVRALSTRSDERTGQLSIKNGELIV